MPWGFTLEDLTALRDELAGEAGGRRDYVRLGLLSRWLGEESESRRWYGAAVSDFEQRVLATGRGESAYARAEYGWLLWRAGEVARAREVLETADGVDELDYLLGRHAGRTGFYGTLASGDAGAIRAARERLVHGLRAERSLPAESWPTMSPYDRLEETFRVEAELLGEPVPDPLTMLRRAGLLLDAPPAPPPPAEPPAAGTWTLGGREWRAYDGGSARIVLREDLVLEIVEELGQYFVRFEEQEGSPPVDTFGEALELAGDVLRAEGEDWAVDVLAELLAHAQGSAFELHRALLEADRDAARRAAEEPTAARLAALARAHRWLDEDEAAERALRAALELDRAGAVAPSGDEARGWRLRLAGDEDGARAAFERALAGTDDDGGRVRLRYLLGRTDEPPVYVEDDPVAARELCSVLYLDHITALAPARETIAAHIRTHRLLPSASDAYDWLEETFRLGARLTGQPVPERRMMLERSGLWRDAPEPPKGPAAPKQTGRRVIGGAVLEVAPIQLTARFADGLELEFLKGTLELWRGEDRLARREGYRSFGEELAGAAELLPPEDIAALYELLRDADPAIRDENERSHAVRHERADFERSRREAEDAGDPAALARAHRWLGDEAEARRWFLRAAEAEPDPARRGGLLWTAGARDRARPVLSEALADARDSSLAFELRCLLGDPPGRGHSDRAQVFSALARENMVDSGEANRNYARRLYAERVLVTDPGPTLAPYDLLYEAIVMRARIGGVEPYRHDTILSFASLDWSWEKE